MTKVPAVFGNSFLLISSLSLKIDMFDTFEYSFHGLISSEIAVLWAEHNEDVVRNGWDSPLWWERWTGGAEAAVIVGVWLWFQTVWVACSGESAAVGGRAVSVIPL